MVFYFSNPEVAPTEMVSMRWFILYIFVVFSMLLVQDVSAKPYVWAIDDGEKVKRDATNLRFKTGQDNPVWSPGQPIKLFSLRNETVAFQIIVENTGDAPLSGVTVDLELLTGPNGAKIQNSAGATDPTNYVGRYIERFVEHYFYIEKHSGLMGEDGYKNSQGWNWGAGPAKDEWIGWMPDALIPVEVAPPGAPYPLVIPAKNNGAIWVDITVPKDQRPGSYKGDVIVSIDGTLATSIPIELDIFDAVLADRPVNTMLCYDENDGYPSSFDLCFEEQKQPAIEHMWKLYHRHRLSSMLFAFSLDDVIDLLPVLKGSFYTKENGYEGPGEGLGEGILSLGRYASFWPNAENLERLRQISAKLLDENLFSTTDVFIYAMDESCDDSLETVRNWKKLYDNCSDPNIDHVDIGWTCSQPVAEQKYGANLAIKQISTYLPEEHVPGKTIWAYNGTQPHSGAFLTDIDAVSIRTNGWLAGVYDIGRWFYWSSTAWYDQFSDRKTYDPYVDPRTFILPGIETDMGDGMLTYPGKQVYRDSEFNTSMVGVVASIRLKNWRRGIQDAGYYQMARKTDRKAAENVATELQLYPDCVMGYITSEASTPCSLYHPPIWSSAGKAFFDARKKLLGIIPAGTDGEDAPSGDDKPPIPPGPGPQPDDDPHLKGGMGCASVHGFANGAFWLLALSVLVLITLKRVAISSK